MVLALVASQGCSNRGGPPAKIAGPETKDDPLAIALSRLEKDSSAATCREVLQIIDAQTAAQESRPTPAPAQIQAVAALLKLDNAEITSLSQKEFTRVDDDYLEECLLVRDGVRSLELKEAPKDATPAEKSQIDAQRAERAFAWVCRQMYISDQPHPPAPTWLVLQAGSGSGIDRAVVFLAVLRQLGLDGCLIGPPELADTPSLQPPVNPRAGPRLAPVRAVGVRIDGDILLFDPWSDQAIVRGGKPVATLAQVRSEPAAAKDWPTLGGAKPDEAKRWEVFLAAPTSAFAVRMEWLEQKIAAANPVRLYVDAQGLLDRFKKATDAQKGVNCRYWNPPDDAVGPVRVLDSYQKESRDLRGLVFSPLKYVFHESHFPRQFMPDSPVEGRPKELIHNRFRAEFVPIFLVHGSPRDHLLRGNFSNASAALTELKERNDTYRDRIAREGKLDDAVIVEWAKQASPIFADLVRAEESGDANAKSQAKRAEENFLRSPLSEKLDLLIRRETSLLLSAEASYQLALLVHEQSERAQTRQAAATDASKSELARSWKGAADRWQRYLDNYPELRLAFKDRDDHARRQLERCQQFLGEPKK